MSSGETALCCSECCVFVCVSAWGKYWSKALGLLLTKQVVSATYLNEDKLTEMSVKDIIKLSIFDILLLRSTLDEIFVCIYVPEMEIFFLRK